MAARAASTEEQRMHRVENAMLKHINAMPNVLGGPVAIYADCPRIKKGKPTGELLRCPFFNPEPGTRLTHISNLGQVNVEVHHRDNSSRFTDFALIFGPLNLVTLKHETSPSAVYPDGPYTARIEFKTSDAAVGFVAAHGEKEFKTSGAFVISEVRVAGKGGRVDTRMIPDPELEQSSKQKSILGQLGGFMKSAVKSSARRVDRTRKGIKKFHELEDDGDEEPECYGHDCEEVLRAWLAQEIAQPVEELLRRDINENSGRGY